MTNEKAVEILKNELACVQNTNCERSECKNCYLVMPEKEITKALNMAIQALGQEPCNDAISRQAVLDYIDNMPSTLTADGRRMIRRRTLEEYISDTLPPVTPEPKMGRWIEMLDDLEEKTYKCSECGEYALEDGWEPWPSKFCPYCGTKMEEE